LSDKPITKDELLEAHMAGGRQSGERSYAVESRYYSKDPLDSFEYPSERLRKEEMKRRERAKRKERK
jgi:hypothetical protein